MREGISDGYNESVWEIDPQMDERSYHSCDEVSNSQLNHLKKSPLHLKAYLASDPTPTPAMVLGSQVHTCVLEHDRFLTDYVVGPGGDRRLKKTKQAYTELEEQGWKPESIIAPAVYEQILSIRSSVLSNPIACKLLLPDEGAVTEASMFWSDEKTGVRCRGRIDAIPAKDSEYGAVLADLKTTRDCGAFAKSAYDFGYYRQAAFYLSGYARGELSPWEIERTAFAIVAVESTPPFGLSIFQFSDEALDLGNSEIDELLAIYKHCQDTNEWPGYEQGIQELSLPNWAFYR